VVGVDVSYTTNTIVGGYIHVVVQMTNVGTATTKPTQFQVGGIKDYADVVSCDPSCDSSEFFGDYYAKFPAGIAPGKSVTYTVEFLATKVGVANWSLVIYEGATDSIWYGTGKIQVH
jgi:hypothetical protein